MTTPTTYVEAPTGQPWPFGLLSVAVVDDRPAADSKWQLGTIYEPNYCGPAFVTDGACRPRDIGTVVASVDDSSTVTLAVDGNPAGSYVIDWGDGSDPVTDATPDGETHTYAADGTYTIVMSGPDAYVATATVHVTDGSASADVDARVAEGYQAVDGVSVVEGIPFTVYHLMECNAVGMEGRIAERARAGLMLGEGRAVESVLAHQLANDVDAVDLTPTPGTAVTLGAGLDILLKWAGQNYGALPTLHADLGIVTDMGSLIVAKRENRRIETLVGVPIAAGAGYVNMHGPGDTAPGAGESWIYITGTVLVMRGTEVDVRPQQHTNPANNRVQALAARPYVVSTECIIGAVLVHQPNAADA